MHSFKSLGMLEPHKTIYLPHWTSFVQQCLALKTGDKGESPLKLIGEIIPPEQIEPLHEALEWLNLIPPIIAPASPISMALLPNSPMVPIDLFAYLLAHKLQYKSHERDMVILSHEIIAQPQVQHLNSHSGKEPDMEVHTSRLITYGTPRASAMARTVGLPVAIAALRILDGKVDVRGAAKPDHPSVYEPVLRGLEEVGLGMEESVSVGVGGDGSMGGGRFTVESKLIQAFAGTDIEHIISR
jgi:alpha-aminoadipic semialdehyde synthase